MDIGAMFDMDCLRPAAWISVARQPVERVCGFERLFNAKTTFSSALEADHWSPLRFD
jgi:hypothetical protein